MSGIFAPGEAAPSGMRGIFKSWLRTWSSEFGPLSEGLPLEAGRPNAHSCESIRVLVVDDNPVNLMVMSALLESRGIVAARAADGAEAVALACKMPFDLILMDLQMPILDGFGATAAIRHFESTCARPAVPVVAYSSALPGAGVLAAVGINGSLAKPCEYEDLERCLVRWCPTYGTESTALGVSSANNRWQAANQGPDSQCASRR